MMTNKLTAKQEAFATKYVECDNASEAYKFAYNCKTMSGKTINEEGCKLLSHPKVAPRIAELQGRVKEIAAEKFTISIEQRLEWAKQVAEAGLHQHRDAEGKLSRYENLAATNKAIEILNNMLGLGDDEDDKGQALTITFDVAAPVKDVKVTNAKT